MNSRRLEIYFDTTQIGLMDFFSWVFFGPKGDGGKNEGLLRPTPRKAWGM